MLAIIGGTGLYALDGMEDAGEERADTPFGPPSAPVRRGRLAGRDALFLPRHGSGHHLLPSEINYRANIYALKRAGARQLVCVSAVGSLREELEPGDFVVPDQYLDMTKGARKATFFGEGVVAHVSTATASCAKMRAALEEAARARGQRVHGGVAYACVEGPRLGTRAESLFLRGPAGAGVVGMTNVPEVFLAREAQLCCATLAIITDYDCWKESPKEHVTVEQVLKRFGASIGAAKGVLAELIARHLPEPDEEHRQVLRNSLITPRDELDAHQKELVGVLEA